MISIHVLRVEDDDYFKREVVTCPVFQSTSSVWRTTQLPAHFVKLVAISIHVLRVEDDHKHTGDFVR